MCYSELWSQQESYRKPGVDLNETVWGSVWLAVPIVALSSAHMSFFQGTMPTHSDPYTSRYGELIEISLALGKEALRIVPQFAPNPRVRGGSHSACLKSERTTDRWVKETSRSFHVTSPLIDTTRDPHLKNYIEFIHSKRSNLAPRTSEGHYCTYIRPIHGLLPLALRLSHSFTSTLPFQFQSHITVCQPTLIFLSLSQLISQFSLPLTLLHSPIYQFPQLQPWHLQRFSCSEAAW